MKKKTLKIIALTLVIIVALIIFISAIAGIGIFKKNPVTKNLDSFAQCLSEKNVTMYGAYWCPHCLNEKALFGDSWKYMQYVECDPNGPNNNAQLCTDLGIDGYPTWIINGEKMPGEVSIDTLAKLSGCSLT